MKPIVARGGSTIRVNLHQLHETEEAGTLALIAREGRRIAHISRRVWEPACGRGRMARVLQAAGYDVTASDLIDRGYGCGGVDFLTTRNLRAPVIITNPPYGPLVEAFIRHAYALGAGYLALLVKADFWQAAGKAARHLLFSELPPTRIHPLGWRLDWTGEGRPVMNCVWLVWDWASSHEPLTGHGGRPFAQHYAAVTKEEALAAQSFRIRRTA